MGSLKSICQSIGFQNPRTYIASGNLAFESNEPQTSAQQKLENALTFGDNKPISVVMRSPDDISTMISANPFSDKPGNRVIVLMLDRDTSETDISSAKNRTNEELHLGNRAIFIYYPDGQGKSKLRLPAMTEGTARNMNTIEKVKALAKN